jgi:hypothetical protein
MRQLLLTLILSPLALAQQDGADPYTGGTRAGLAAAGYANLGPFRIGGYHGSADVDRLLLPTPVRWIETAHFKIGTTLGEYRVPQDREQRRKLEAELEVLGARLPAVDPKARVLDPWLRAHLIAQRCEEVYADFQRRLRVTDLDFPQRPQDARRGTVFMGLGPYLGQQQKYAVLVFDQAHEVAAYSRAYLGEELRWPQRHNLGLGRSLLFVTSPELGGWLGDDTAMHVHLCYDVVHLLVDGYRGFGHETPVWFKTGLAQWYARRIDPRYPNFDRPPEGPPKGSMLWNWEPIVARLCRDGRARPMAEMAAFRDYRDFAFEDYVLAWSRVAFLVERFGDRGLRDFLFHLKEPPGPGPGTPDWDLVLATQETARTAAFGFADWESLDRAWQASIGGIAQASGGSPRRGRR